MNREPDIGVLSTAEDPSGKGVREHYDLMLAITKKAAEELRAKLFEGVPHMQPQNPSARYAHAKTARLINAFAWANRCLWLAAQTVQEIEHLSDDELVSEVLL